MSYSFAGFFARPLVERPADLPPGAAWRAIETPFSGSGVRLPELLGKSPTAADLKRLACRIGLTSSSDWLFIAYDCWAGPVDFVFGIGSRGGNSFGPIEETRADENRAAYIRLMNEFGVASEDALDFTPFNRGFWGED